MEPPPTPENATAKNPNLDLAQYQFLLMHTQYDPRLKREVRDKFMALIVENEMGVYYETICGDMNIPVDEALLADLKAKNKSKLEAMDAAIADAVANLGDTEVREAYQKKAEYLCQIGDRDASLKTFQLTFDRTVGVGHRIDVVLHQIRIGFFYLNHKLIKKSMSSAKDLIEQGGDWDRKNRLKVYEGYYSLVTRDFRRAAELLLDSISTFTSYELISYERLVFYAIVAAMRSLERTELKEKVIKVAEIKEQLFGQPELRRYLTSLYECDYCGFFRSLAYLERQLQFDRIFASHYGQYVRAMRAKAYKQLLSSYRSLSLQYMADAFGVSSAFIDKDLRHFITTGVLHCKIDHVNGVVDTNRRDTKSELYTTLIKDSDNLLNRIQKLSRIINI